MEKLQQLCEKQHEQINTIIAAQGAQLKELQHQIAELQEHRKANQQPLREVTDTLAQLTGKIVGIWEMSKGVVVKDSQGMGEPLETPDSPGLDGSPAGAIAVLDASKASITVGPQTRTTALNAAPNVSITVSSPRSTTATVLKPRDSAVSSIKASTSAAVAALSTSSTTTADPNPKIHAKHAFVAASNDTGFDRTWGTETSLISGEPKAKVLAKIGNPPFLEANANLTFTDTSSTYTKLNPEASANERKPKNMMGTKNIVRRLKFRGYSGGMVGVCMTRVMDKGECLLLFWIWDPVWGGCLSPDVKSNVDVWMANSERTSFVTTEDLFKLGPPRPQTSNLEFSSFQTHLLPVFQSFIQLIRGLLLLNAQYA